MQLPIPLRCIQTLHRSPLALGCYAFIAWLYVEYARDEGRPVPLSERDICAYDEPRSRGSARRALIRLKTAAWIIADTSELKTRYTPTWGMIKRTVRPWDLDQPRWGRPDHLTMVMFDTALFVRYFGTLTPVAVGKAWITATSMPQLTLTDIGIYLQAQAGQTISSPRLVELGLLPAPAAPASANGDPHAPTL